MGKTIFINSDSGEWIPEYKYNEMMRDGSDPEEFEAVPLYCFHDAAHDEIITTVDIFREWIALPESEKIGDTFREYFHRIVRDTDRNQNDLKII